MVELLAPAGSMEALKAAIAGGADAIYVGGSRFNARAYATNFDINELSEAVKLCHLHGVRLFVTVNTLYKENEIEELYDYLKDLYNIQVDALIVQDEGIMRFINRHFKNFEIHASTQCSVHNVDGVLHYKNLGLKRVVVARENTIEEIKAMVKTECEIEAFVHGALCVSYSGQCFMSQMIGKRSANRGMCAQPCRLPYALYLNDKKIHNQSFLMSCKDLCTIEHIPELIDAGIKSFKIEGRMKRPEYVYAITKAYRNAIDKKENVSIEVLKQLFNRDFTSGYLFNEKTIISPEYSGNRGIILGTVIGYDQKIKRLKIKSNVEIHQGDGIRIGFSEEGKILNKLYQKGKLCNQVSKNEIFEIDYDKKIKNETLIYRTTDFSLEKQIQKELLSTTRKHPITMTLSGKAGENACLKIDDSHNSVSVFSNNLLEIANKPTDFERIEIQLKKLGNTIYEAESIILNIEPNVFISISEINDLRRRACDKLDTLRANKKVREKNHILPFTQRTKVNKKMHATYFHFHTLEQLNAALPLNDEDVAFFDLTDEFENAKTISPNLGLVIPTICDQKMFNLIDELIEKYKDLKVAVNNIGAYERYKNRSVLLLTGMNLSHSEAHQCYDIPAVLSLDMEYQDEKATLLKQKDIVLMTYGHIDNMLTKHCVVSYQKYGKKIENCQQCKKGNYHLTDRMNARFPLLFEKNCIVHILSEKPIQRKKTHHQYVRFTIENYEEVKEILRKYRI